jgi:EAL domain-containing protein (putative c-di-GMP-specific phosphodiesterase class I)/ActR/RegA family two-component response regulator
VNFPNLNLMAQAPPAPDSVHENACEARRVLIIDDDESLLQTLARMAGKLGAKVRTCSSWPSFEAAIGEFNPDLVLVDLMMPDVDGIDVLERICLEPGVDCYVMTGADSRTLEASLEVVTGSGASIAGTLKKPFSAADFKALLESAPRDQSYCAPAVKKQPRRKLLTPDQFKKAVLDERIDPFFQPIFHADGTRLKGFEALARVRGEANGYFAPEYLNQLVHDGRLSMLLTESITKKALAFLASLKSHRELTISINIFGFHAATDGFREGLLHHCAINGIAHHRVILELSEATVFRLTSEDLRKITKLRLAGFELSIDDLGTGDSSLGRLANLPFSEMKIDKSFCLAVDQSDTARAVIEACLGLAQRLQMRVTAEGAENREIARILREMGCDALQGHYFGQALSPEAVQSWMEAGCPRHAAEPGE